jgi:tRNA U34 5-methylaminomethyl-2-thiouridine-forming methyltransferase MnmC
LKRNIVTTADGSKTIQIEEWNEQYHSLHGAIQEARHVFIKNGLHYFVDNYRFKLLDEAIHILEIGFGTGLNAFITLLEAEKLNLQINYVGVEAFPVLNEEIAELNYVEQLSVDHHQENFDKLHTCKWEMSNEIIARFNLTKQKKEFQKIDDVMTFDLIYFDAFGARVQPELWTEVIFDRMFKALKPNGILVTYSAKGSVRRAMQSVGFLVEKLQGPPGKREMLRATKHSAKRNEPNVD